MNKPVFHQLLWVASLNLKLVFDLDCQCVSSERRESPSDGEVELQSLFFFLIFLYYIQGPCPVSVRQLAL